MIATEIEFIPNMDGKYRRCTIIADSKPPMLPKTGKEIENLRSDIILGIGSRIICLAENEEFIRGEMGWYKH